MSSAKPVEYNMHDEPAVLRIARRTEGVGSAIRIGTVLTHIIHAGVPHHLGCLRFRGITVESSVSSGTFEKSLITAGMDIRLARLGETYEL